MANTNANGSIHVKLSNGDLCKIAPSTKIECVDGLQTILNELSIGIPQTQALKKEFSSADTWEYTGISITVPAGQAHIMFASITWDSGQPSGLVLSEASDPAQISKYNIIGMVESVEGQYTLSFVCQSTTPSTNTKTFYLYAKNISASGKSGVRLTSIRIV